MLPYPVQPIHCFIFLPLPMSWDWRLTLTHLTVCTGELITCWISDLPENGRHQFFYYAGGVPAVMEEIKSMLHLDVMTVTGKHLGRKSGRA